VLGETEEQGAVQQVGDVVVEKKEWAKDAVWSTVCREEMWL
jgi:hypothetical protein